MGRLTQIIKYLNAEDTPTADEVNTVYTHLEITDDLKKYRKEYRCMLKTLPKDDQIKLWD